MAEVRLDRVKTWEQTLSETLHGDRRVHLLPMDHELLYAGPLKAKLIEWSWPDYLARTPWIAEREPEGTYAELVREGILAAHPWLRLDEPEPERPVVLEVTRPAIPLSRVLRVLSELLGFDASRRLVEATFGIGGVTLELYSEGPDGRRFAIGPDHEVARDLIVLPIDRDA